MKEIVFTRKLLQKNKIKLIDSGFNVLDYDFVILKHNVITIDILKRIQNNVNPWFIASKFSLEALMKGIDNNLEMLNTIDVIAIKPKTSTECKNLGFNVLYSGVDTNEIVDILNKNSINKIAYINSNIKNDFFTNLLKSNNIEYDNFELYSKTFGSIKLGSSIKYVTFFSPSQVMSFLSNNSLPKNAHIYCIGNTTFGYLKQLGYNNLKISEMPTEESIINMIIKEN